MKKRSTEEFRERLRSLGLSGDGITDDKQQRPAGATDGEPKNHQPGAAAAKTDAAVAEMDGNMPVEAAAADMARQLEAYFRQFGDKRFRDAARLLTKPPPNRPNKPADDDELDLAIMSVLTQGENALGDMEAARKVASHYPEQDRGLIAKRLHDQWQRRGRC